MPVQNADEKSWKLRIITILPKSRLRGAAIPGDKSTTTEPTRSNELSEFAPQPPPRLLSWTGSAVFGPAYCALCPDRRYPRRYPRRHPRARPRRRAASGKAQPIPAEIKLKISRFGQDPALATPQRPAILASLPLGPVLKHGSGNISPPAPRGQAQGPGSRGDHPPDALVPDALSSS